VTDAGRLTAEWINAIADRHPKEEIDRIAKEARPFSPSEHAWLDLIRKKSARWSQSTPNLRLPFPATPAPSKVVILVGNRGGDDGFTYEKSTIAFDVSSLVANFGEVSSDGNLDRLHRLFAHEYTHLLHKAWLDQHPLTLATPLERALWECLYEGIGNYRSLSEKWVSANGELTDLGRSTLKELTPVFVARMERLASAKLTEEKELRAGLSSGPFNKKWGALPVALWLAQEARGDDSRLSSWIDRGPAAVLELAMKYLRGNDSARIKKLTPSQAGTDEHAQSLFVEKRVYGALAEAYKSKPDRPAKEWSDIWWQDFISQEKVLAAMQGADVGNKDLHAWLRKKLGNRGGELPHFLRDAEGLRSTIMKKAAASFDKLSAAIPFQKPIEIYHVLHIHDFNAKEFVVSGEPAFAVNLAYGGWRREEDTQIERTFIHEGFHVLHLRQAGDDLLKSPEGLIFREGLAVLATSKILPGGTAGDDAYLSNADIDVINKNLPALAAAILTDLDKGYVVVNQKYFSASSKFEQWPPRCGYHVGRLAIEAAAPQKTLKELLHLSPSSYSDLVRSGLTTLAKR
jgi:hypothetical protein